MTEYGFTEKQVNDAYKRAECFFAKHNTLHVTLDVADKMNIAFLIGYFSALNNLQLINDDKIIARLLSILYDTEY